MVVWFSVADEDSLDAFDLDGEELRAQEFDDEHPSTMLAPPRISVVT